MLNIEKMESLKKIIIIPLVLGLVACGGGSSSSGSGGSADEASNEFDLPSARNGDNCVIKNIVLDPPNGSTLNRSSQDELLITIDFEVLENTEEMFIEAIFESIDQDDGGLTTFGEDIKQYNVEPGRIIDDIRFRVTDFDNDQYTTIKINGYSGTVGCDVDLDVNYIVTD